MNVLIGKNDTQGHIINKYKFKVLAMGSNGTLEVQQDETQLPVQEQLLEANEAPAIQQEMKPSGSRDELVESLMQKTDEMSSNFIKMQMKLESAEEEYKVQLEAAKKEAFDEGVAAGRAQVESEFAAAKTEGITQFSASVSTLEQSARTFHDALTGIQQELLHAALDIAKEVVAAEVQEHSGEIAERLSKQLIEELQGASKITLRVNPADHGVISENVGKLDHVEIVSDSAVSPGGVIAISEAGNIDAEIMKRYERVKRAALSG